MKRKAVRPSEARMYQREGLHIPDENLQQRQASVKDAASLRQLETRSSNQAFSFAKGALRIR